MHMLSQASEAVGYVGGGRNCWMRAVALGGGEVNAPPPNQRLDFSKHWGNTEGPKYIRTTHNTIGGPALPDISPWFRRI